jgi:S-methylmethionine-dependent homocysteine/selenocysteine methylase
MNHIEKKIDSTIFLTDGGLETDLIFNKNIDLPHFAVFPLIENSIHEKTLKNYYEEYLNIAKEHNTGFILESPTWRANTDWAYKLGYSAKELDQLNAKAIELLTELKVSYQNDIENILISGQIGPRGDGYLIDNKMTVSDARTYHFDQINVFKKSGVDMVSFLTVNYTDEALGACLAAKQLKVPVIISYTVETDGCLPSGESLGEAITRIDQETDNYPLYYMINCAHPSHFFDIIEGNHEWKNRIKGIRANASCKSHAELDDSTELDIGDLKDLGNWHIKLRSQLPQLKVYGGCCGTDASHVKTIIKTIKIKN